VWEFLSRSVSIGIQPKATKSVKMIPKKVNVVQCFNLTVTH